MKRLLVASLVPIAILACGKSHSNATVFQLTLNGANYSFDSVVAWVDTSQGIFFTTIDGLNTKTRSHFRVEAQSNKKTLNGTYTHMPPYPDNCILVVFGCTVVSGINVNTYVAQGTAEFLFNISSSDSKNISGSFTGTLVDLGGVKNANTTGQFHLPYQLR
jgi:hypothetical protein